MKLNFWKFCNDKFVKCLPPKVPLHLKLTLYTCPIALISMAVVAAVCITQSLGETHRLMYDRLQHFASVKADQTERGIHTQALTLDTALQGDRITSTLQSVYFGNITSWDWATEMNSMVSEMFTTTLRTVQLITFYDVRGNILYSSRNPEFPHDSMNQLESRFSSLFPLGHSVNITVNSNDIPKSITEIDHTSNYTIIALNQTFGVSNDTQLESFAAQAAIDAAQTQNSSTAMGRTNSNQNRYTPPVEFEQLGNGLSSWMSPPAPLFDDDDNINAYSYSLTSPINYLEEIGSTQASMLIGYCTVVLDASMYMNGSYTMESTTRSHDDDNFSLSIVEATEKNWEFLFPSDISELNKPHPLYTFPAVQADIDLWLKYEISNFKASRNPGGCMMNTNAPGINRASVGYSFVNAIGSVWMILVSIPTSKVEQSYWNQTYKQLGVLFSVTIFLIITVIFSTRAIIAPVGYISRGMELKSRKFHQIQNQDDNKKIEYLEVDEISQYANTEVSSDTAVDDLSEEEKEKGNINQSPNNSFHEKQIFPVNSEALSTRKIRRSLQSILKINHQTTINEATGLADTESDNKDEPEVFKVPEKIKPLDRWFTNEYDKLVTAYNTLVDILLTEHLTLEDRVRSRTREAFESQRLAEAASFAKSRFLMHISHEIITPINGVLGMAAVSKEEEDIPQIKEGIRTIIKSGEVFSEFLNKLLTYTSYLSGIEHSFQQFTLQKLATNIRDTFTNRAKERGIDFKLQINPHDLERCEVESDFEHIVHICANLVSNAIKFSDPAKVRELSHVHRFNDHRLQTNCSPSAKHPIVWMKITLRKPNKYVELPDGVGAAADNYAMLEISIRDNGVGITKSKLASIFELFEQGEDVLSKHFTGTGLGLAMSKLLCEGLGGSISVSSCRNVGTVVELRVPVRNVDNYHIEDKPPASPQFEGRKPHQDIWRISTKFPQLVRLWVRKRSQSEHSLSDKTHHPSSSDSTTVTQNSKCSSLMKDRFSSIPDLDKWSVLVVDDNKLLRDIFIQWLVKIGIGTIHSAADGREAIHSVESAIVKGLGYNIIFMDIQMPGTDGIEATKDIRCLLGYNSPVVGLTGDARPKIVNKCQQLGFSRILVKPVSIEDLREVVQDVHFKNLPKHDTKPPQTLD